MCTDRTTKEHINKYFAICDEIKRLEALKKQESAWIIAELNARGVDTFGGVQVLEKSRKTYSEKNLIAVLGDVFTAAAAEIATISTWHELRRAKA